MASESERVGSVGEEAVKLLRALATESRRTTDPVGHAVDEPAPAGPIHDTAAGEHVCSTAWCPVCRIVGLVKENPELIDQLTDSVATFARSVRDALDQTVTPREEQR